mmetsp:Transcript_50917/g.94271  ORF Transcript_50917/g.94271 Transcript_50917/m.94271 type:complete len:263 (+) Transcript_50917:770-1558(+)
MDVSQSLLLTTLKSPPDVVRVHLLRELHVRYCVEPAQEFIALVLQVRLDLPWSLGAVRRVGCGLELPSELLLVPPGGTVRDHTDLASDAESRQGRIGRIDVPSVPLGIGVDGLTLRLRDGDLPRRVSGTASDRHDATNIGSRSSRGIVHGERTRDGTGLGGVLDDLHAPERAPHNALDGIDAEVVSEHVQLEADGVADGDVGEVDAVGSSAGGIILLLFVGLPGCRRIGSAAGGTRRSVAAPQNVRAHHEVLGRIQRLSRSQ